MATNNATNTSNPITVAQGGTGVASTTAYAVLCGGTTSTGALQSIAGVGTSGQVLTSNGAGALPTFQAASGGKFVQATFASLNTVQTGTTQIPNDDTIPQNTEGTEFLTCSITPTNSSNKLVITAHFNVSETSTAGTSYIIGALFQDSTANALAVSALTNAAANSYNIMTIYYEMTAGTTSATTFKVRIGPEQSATITVNGINSARKFGGVYSSWIQVSEIST